MISSITSAYLLLAGVSAVPDTDVLNDRPSINDGPSTSAAEAARTFREQTLYIRQRYSFMSSICAYQNGRQIDLGYFGGNSGRFFIPHPAVDKQLKLYKRLKITGFAFWTLGTAALLTDCVLLTRTDHWSMGEMSAFFGLLGGGVFSSVIGQVALNQADKRLNEAIIAHNAKIVDRFLPPSERLFSGPSPRTAPGARVSLRFAF